MSQFYLVLNHSAPLLSNTPQANPFVYVFDLPKLAVYDATMIMANPAQTIPNTLELKERGVPSPTPLHYGSNQPEFET